ncbi:hypothetical protein WL37_03365 [Burkholderia ubonensis]|nr:hypothetical protein WL37_03365 [Burkholderia ubonensis]
MQAACQLHHTFPEINQLGWSNLLTTFPMCNTVALFQQLLDLVDISDLSSFKTRRPLFFYNIYYHFQCPVSKLASF